MGITILTRGQLKEMREGKQPTVTLDAVEAVAAIEKTDDDKVIELADEGMEIKDIAQETGLSSQKVSAILRKGK